MIIYKKKHFFILNFKKEINQKFDLLFIFIYFFVIIWFKIIFETFTFVDVIVKFIPTILIIFMIITIIINFIS